MRDAGEQDQRPRCGLRLAAGAEDGECLVERGRGLARAAGLEGGVRPADEELGPLGIVGGRELERPGEPRFRLGGVEAERPLAGEREEAPRRQGELRRLLRVAGGLGELECLQVVVGEHLGQVLDPLACLALDPGGRGAVPARPLRPRDLAVGDVADEQVPERVLALALHRARPGRADELLAGQLVQRQLELAPVAAADLGQRHRPRTPSRARPRPGAGSCAPRVSVSRRAAISACKLSGNSVSPGSQAAVGEQAHELLRIQRVPARPLEHASLQLRG